MVFASLESFPKGKTCSLCSTNTIDRLTLGDIYQIADVVVHYFCLLLASKGEQRGTDRQGLLGFLLKDIKKEIKRGSRIKCIYCQRKGATVICAKEKCKTNFHLPCGLKENSLHFFCNEFKSFCVKHRPKIVFPTWLKKSIIENRTLCILCFTPVNLNDTLNLIWPPCCKPHSIQHKQCVQKMAYTAGYYFKCPFCTNIKKFYKYVRESGIYIPEQEASWEREPRAYSDYTVELKCVAEPCICPKGNLYNRSNTKWNLKSCNTCGGNAIHSDCFKKLKRSDFTIYWQCSDCIPSRTDEFTSIGVGNSTYGYSSCNNMDVTCTLADENAPVQEENEDYENRRVEMEPLQKRGQLVTDLKRYIENNNENLVFVDSDFLNETLKIVSYNVEVIVDNKRCIVSLNKLNNDTLTDEQSDVSKKSS